MDPVRGLARAKGASPEDLGEATSNGMDKKNTQLLIIILIVSFLLSFSFSESLFFSWQNKFIDFLQTSKSPSGEILIVAIDEQSINSIGQWPWPRSVFGRAL